MRLQGLPAFVLMVFGFTLTGCQVFGPEEQEFEKTYPDAQDFPLITLRAAIDSVAAPSQNNVRVYVVGITVCPADARCAISDGITIASRQQIDFKTDLWVHVPVIEPRQFILGWQYLLSIEIIEDVPGDGDPHRLLRLIGYD